ncbi:MAG: tetratricopeptide repeat protein [Saprospiraceae bacterium]|nr:tetratricopeptide repeat protein [Saprospiraceae bacterium]
MKGRFDKIKTAVRKFIDSKTDFFKISVLIILAFVLYGNTLRNDYVLDDYYTYLGNSYVQQGFSGIDEIVSHGFLHGFNGQNDEFYRPMVLVSFAIENQFFGNNPVAGHFFNIIFYIVALIVLYFFLKKFLHERHPILPFIITITFLFHPIHTEVVANIKSRDEILQFIFAISSLSFLLTYINTKKIWNLVLSSILFFFALLSKEATITFLAIIPLVLFFRYRLKIFQIFIYTIPFVLIAGFYGFLRYSVLDNFTFSGDIVVIDNTLMATSNIFEQLATSFILMLKYLQLLVFPYALSFDYSYGYFAIHDFSSPLVIFSVLLFVGLLVFALINLKKRSLFSFSILFFLISISIVSNIFIKITATFGERFLFTASLAFCIALVLLVARISRSKFTKKLLLNHYSFYALFLLTLFFYGVKTINRNRDWQNNLTLFESALEVSPKSARVQQSLASEYLKISNSNQNPQIKSDYLNKAILHFNKSLEILPEYSESWYNLGTIYQSTANYEQAKLCYLKAYELNTDFVNALDNLGVIHFIEGDQIKAEEYFNKVINEKPEYSSAYSNLGAIEFNKGLFQKAIQLYEKAIALNPNNTKAYNDLSFIYKNIGNHEKAEFYLQRANKVKNTFVN